MAHFVILTCWIIQYAAHVKEITVQYGPPTCLWQTAIHVIEGWFAGRQWKMYKWYTYPPKLVCEVYTIYTI